MGIHFITSIILLIIMLFCSYLLNFLEKQKNYSLLNKDKYTIYVLIFLIISLTIVYGNMIKNTILSSSYFLITNLYIIYSTYKYSKNSPLYQYNSFRENNLYSELLSGYNLLIFFILIIEKISLKNISKFVFEISLLYLSVSYLIFLRSCSDRIKNDDKKKMKISIIVTIVLYLISIFIFNENILFKLFVFLCILIIAFIQTNKKLSDGIQSLITILIGLIFIFSVTFFNLSNVKMDEEKVQKEKIYVNNNLDEICEYEENENFAFISEETVKYGAEIIVYTVLEENGKKYITENYRVFDYTVKKADERQYLEKITELYIISRNNNEIDKQDETKCVKYVLYY